MHCRLIFAHALNVSARQTRFGHLLAHKFNFLSHPHDVAVFVFTLGRHMLQSLRQIGNALFKHLIQMDLGKCKENIQQKEKNKLIVWNVL